MRSNRETGHTQNFVLILQICVAKKKQVGVISIREDKLQVERTRDLPDTITALVMDGDFVCAALTSVYVICNVQTGECQELFPFEHTPAIARVSKVSQRSIEVKFIN